MGTWRPVGFAGRSTPVSIVGRVLLPAGTGPDHHKNVGELCNVRPDDVKPMVAELGLVQARVTRWWRMTPKRSSGHE